MSPEQAEGKPLDARSDIFSFVVMLYEMLARSRPFAGRTDLEVLQAIVHNSPAPLAKDLPLPLRMAVDKALEKEPSRRYQSMHEMVVDLRRVVVQPNSAPINPAWKWGAAVLVIAVVGAGLWKEWPRAAADEAVHSIAVLPLENLSGDANQEYFSDGITEALISSLAQVRSLQVISRTSVMRYKHTTELVPEIAKELGTDAIVEGSVQRASGRVRITADLIRASTDKHLWGNSYDRDLADTLKLEAEVAHAIAQEIQARITPEESSRLASARRVVPAAYEEYTLGRYYSEKFNPQDFARAASHLKRAIDLDPQWAEAHVALGWVLGGKDPESDRQVERALELNPNLAEAHALLANHRVRIWDWDGAEREFRRALELEPDAESACPQCFAQFLASEGRLSPARAIIDHAARFNPVDSNVQMNYGTVEFAAGNYPEAVPRLQRAIELEPRNYHARNILANVYEAAGKPSDAVAVLDHPEFQGSAALARAYALAGRRDDARRILQALTKAGEHPDHQGIADACFALGETDEGLKWLSQALDAQDPAVQWIKRSHVYDQVRSDPRFQDLVARLKLP